MKTSSFVLWHRLKAWLRMMDPIRLLLLGYVTYIVIGWVLLCMPFSHQVDDLKWLDHLFMTVSAVSTTGLTTISTSDSYNFFGELVLLSLIQFGGLGYMTISSFTILAIGGHLSVVRKRVATTALALPEGFDVHAFLRVIIGFTFAIELLGALALYPVFVRHGAPGPAWQAIFHSISAFCTAGFGLFNNSLESYRDDVQLNVIVIVLSYLGAIGFIVLHDVWKSVRHLKPCITLTSKVILLSTFWIGLVGTILFALDEPSVRSLPPLQRWMASLFQVMTASTTVGFNTVPMGEVSAATMVLLTAVMIIGASPSGTGGGLKTTTFTAVWAIMMSMIRRRDQTTFLGREIPATRLRAATAVMMFYAIVLAAGIYALALVEQSPLPDQIFECASALGTVGLSRGITGSLTAIGKLIIIGLMFLGRVGPIVLVMAFFERKSEVGETARLLREDVAI
jgi:trk system potassium uptake protein TrkH